MRHSLIVMLRVLVAAALLIGCSRGSDSALAELLKDPMASRSQPGATLTTADDIPSSEGGLILKKPRSTKVLRAFAPQGRSATSLYDQLLTSATASGWRLERATNGSHGTKQLSFGTASISININRYVSPVQVSVVLEPTS